MKLFLLGCAMLAGCATEPTPAPRIVLFGDSNFDLGFVGQDSVWVSASYISPLAHHQFANESHQLAGKLERATGLVVVNHAIGGTTSGVGFHPVNGAPNALATINGVTRFEAEVLGLGNPWDAGVTRVKAFQPGPQDFAVIGIGTNDGPDGLSVDETIANLASMVFRWHCAGLPMNHVLLTTLPPFERNRPDLSRAVVERNTQIQQLAAATGAGLINLNDYLAVGPRWRDASLQVGDGIHYSEPVRDWLARYIASYIFMLGG